MNGDIVALVKLLTSCTTWKFVSDTTALLNLRKVLKCREGDIFSRVFLLVWLLAAIAPHGGVCDTSSNVFCTTLASPPVGSSSDDSSSLLLKSEDLKSLPKITGHRAGEQHCPLPKNLQCLTKRLSSFVLAKLAVFSLRVRNQSFITVFSNIPHLTEG